MGKRCPYCGGRMGMFTSGPSLGSLPTLPKPKPKRRAKKKRGAASTRGHPK